MVDFALQLADGLIIPVTVAESAFNDLRQRTHAVERLELQHLDTLDFLHARIGVFIQQRIAMRKFYTQNQMKSLHSVCIIGVKSLF